MITVSFGAILLIIAGICFVYALVKGKLGPLWDAIHEMLCGADGRMSSKNCGYFMGAATLCVSFAKLNLALCRRIDQPNSNFDPTMVYIALLGFVAALVGGVVVASSAIQAKLQAKLQGTPDAATQNIGSVENLTQDGPK
jgi:drug/metabolite transporter (DMT)-like permease